MSPDGEVNVGRQVVWSKSQVHILEALKKQESFICIYFFFERENMSGGAEGEGEKVKQTLCWARSPGAPSHDPEIMTWAEIKSQILNWLSHPGTPKQESLKKRSIYFEKIMDSHYITTYNIKTRKFILVKSTDLIKITDFLLTFNSLVSSFLQKTFIKPWA